MTGDGRLVTAIVRGDYDVNETKLVNAVKATGGMRPATVEEIKAAGMEPGYGSPIGAHDTVVVVDDLVARSPNLVAGANREGFHYRNVNSRARLHGRHRDRPHQRPGGRPLPDLRRAGDPPERDRGRQHLQARHQVHRAAGASYLGEDGVAHKIVMGSYGIGVGRNVACIVEAHHDDKGIVWPAEVAPYAAHLVSIGAARDPKVDEAAERIHAFSIAAGREILWDDRDESPGVKFTDAELLGMPWILTVSPRSLAAGGVEVTERATGERSTRSIEDVEALLAGTSETGRSCLPRPAVPADDLYAQLDLPIDASPEAIEVAWRGLLRLHHPDVAGPAGLERAKRINVAHDWLSDPGLRARYDRERGLHGAATTGSSRQRARAAARVSRSGRPSAAARPPTGAAPGPDDPAEAIARFLDRLSSLTADELDRLAAADPAPIAFGATIRRFLPDDRRADLEAGRRGDRPPAAGRRPGSSSGTRGVIEAYAAELVLGRSSTTS